MSYIATEIKIDGKVYKILDDNLTKICIGEDYNFLFRKKDGNFARWGKNQEHDPDFSPIGPELADVEITTSCQGVPNKSGIKAPCSFCYKSNTPNGKYMTLENFNKIFGKFNKVLNQIAFGADAELKTNPEWFEIFKYAKDHDVVPNVTVANIDDETADKLASVCGAVAVSRYDNKHICYDTVKKLTDRGMTQINIHIMAAENTFDNLMETLKDKLVDSRLKKLNAIVILSLKKCGRGKNLNQLSQDKFKEVIKFALENGIKIGFDSCSCGKFLSSIDNMKMDDKSKAMLKMSSEPCESTCFSIYIDVEGKVFPCSFCPEIWKNEGIEGIDMLQVEDFLKDVWYNPKIVEFRNNLIKNNRKCPVYEV